MLRTVIRRLVDIVRKKIRTEMIGAERGSIMYDAWTKFNNHYVAVLVMFKHPVTKEVTSRLVSCRPLMKDERLEDNDSEPGSIRVVEMEVTGENGKKETESIVFTAEAYESQIRNDFEKLDVNLVEWLVCQITDNASVMAKVARLLGIGHVGCKNHATHLSVKDSLPVDTTKEKIDAHPNKDFVYTIKSANQTMKDAKRQGKAGKVLSGLTNYRPTMMVSNRYESCLYFYLL